jgi:hypothetical protein
MIKPKNEVVNAALYGVLPPPQIMKAWMRCFIQKRKTETVVTYFKNYRILIRYPAPKWMYANLTA